MIYIFLGILIIIPFLIFFILCIQNYFISKKILVLIKKTNANEWKHLTSSSLPIIKYLVNENFIWINFMRFNNFLKSKDYSNNSDLTECINLYKKNRNIANICFVAITAITIGIIIFSFSEINRVRP